MRTLHWAAVQTSVAAVAEAYLEVAGAVELAVQDMAFDDTLDVEDEVGEQVV